MRDIEVAILTDGTQLTMKKHSNTWVLILIILDLPPRSQYKTEHIIINVTTLSPNFPRDIESFIQSLFEDNHAHIVMAVSDMLMGRASSMCT